MKGLLRSYLMILNILIKERETFLNVEGEKAFFPILKNVRSDEN